MFRSSFRHWCQVPGTNFLYPSLRIGFLGSGEVTEVLAKAINHNLVTAESQLRFCDINRRRLQFMAKTFPQSCCVNFKLAEDCDVVVLALQPQQWETAVEKIGPRLTERHLVISVMAGISINNLRQRLGVEPRIVRAMPNAPVAVGKGATAYSACSDVSSNDDKVVQAIFGAAGTCHRVDESVMDAVTGCSGSGPAFACLFMEAMQAGGVAAGLPADLSAALTYHTVQGTAEMLLKMSQHPAMLRDMVCSPAGTSIYGVMEMEKAAVRAAFMQAVQDSAAQCRKLYLQYDAKTALPSHDDRKETPPSPQFAPNPNFSVPIVTEEERPCQYPNLRMGFVGSGQMAEALAKSIVREHLVPLESITFVETYKPRMEAIKKIFPGCKFTTKINTDDYDVVFVAVKPQKFADVSAVLSKTLTEKHCVVSIMAGISLQGLRTALGPRCRLVRTMPNTPMQCGVGTTAYSNGDDITEEDINIVEAVFGSAGFCRNVDESMMDAVTGVSGSGPAITSVFLEAMAKGAVAAGLPADMASTLTNQTVFGTASMLIEKAAPHPAILREQVCSPGGSAWHGVAALEKMAVRCAVMDSVQAAATRSTELGTRNSKKK